MRLKLSTWIKKIVSNEYLILILMIGDFLQFLSPLTKKINMSDIIEFYGNYDWYGFITKLIIVILLFFALRRNRQLNEKLTADTNLLNEASKELDNKFEDYKLAKGHIDQMLMQGNSAGIRCFVAYINSFETQEEVKRIAHILLENGLVITDCENIGISPAIIASMRKEYYSNQYNNQVEILDNIYPKESSVLDETNK